MKTKLTALTLAMLPALGFSAAAETVKFKDDSIIVVYKESATSADKMSARALVGASIADMNADGRDDKFSHLMKGRIAKFQLQGMSVKDAISKLQGNPAIAIAEPNFIWSVDATPNDEFYELLYAMNNTGQTGGTADADIDAAEAWDISTGSSDVVVGVIDTGVQYDHPDLVNNMWMNPGEIAGNGIDDDGNGYIDDIYGIDTVNGDSDPYDDQGHGTHVSGTIGAEGNNSIGVVGVNHDVSIVGCKFLAADGFGSTEGAIACIDYMVALKADGVNIKALNNSWGGGSYSAALEASIQAAADADILFVAAAGNDGVNNDNSPHYPSSYEVDNVLAVASTNHNDGDSGYSYGLMSVDMGAPGTDIGSTYVDDSYVYASGTSMATPHVAGAAALVWSVNPTLSAVEVKALLMETGDDNAFLTGKSVSGKRLNVYNALLGADPQPSFGLGVADPTMEVTAGDTAEFVFSISSIADWTGEVTFSVTDPLGGASFSSTTAMPGDEVTLFTPTADDTPWGDYQFVVTAVSDDIERSQTVTLTVLPAGLMDVTYSNNTPVSIPDNDSAGVTSTITVADPYTVFGTEVSVDITHTWIGDLIVELTSPTGTTVNLHNRSGSSDDDIVATYSVDSFNGEMMNGDWVLSISDNAGQDLGTLNSWSLSFRALGEVTNAPPVAGFEVSTDELTATFSDTSTDPDDDIVSWDWSFGDGGSSSAMNPVYTYAAEGTYSVSLTVTDSEGQSDTYSDTVTVSEPAAVVIIADIRRSVLRPNGTLVSLLTWRPTPAPTVDIIRNGVVVATVANTGRYRDVARNVTDTEFTYQICDDRGCSDEMTVSF
tara:strand:- start:18767 stop:21253 length:2487 start_codon:yes stop_codon:yes gene_type:complete